MGQDGDSGRDVPPPYYGPGETPPTPDYSLPDQGAPAAYGSPPSQGPPPAYGTPPGYGPPAYPPGYGWQPNPTPASMILLVVIAGIATTTCYFTLAGLPAVILGALALSRNARDPQDAARLARIGWIVLGSVSAFIVVAAAVTIGFAVAQGG